VGDDSVVRPEQRIETVGTVYCDGSVADDDVLAVVGGVGFGDGDGGGEFGGGRGHHETHETHEKETRKLYRQRCATSDHKGCWVTELDWVGLGERMSARARMQGGDWGLGIEAVVTVSVVR